MILFKTKTILGYSPWNTTILREKSLVRAIVVTWKVRNTPVK